jgi:hypothetical protein
MKLFPFVSRHTVIFRPRRMKVNTSPYYCAVSFGPSPPFAVLCAHLLPVREEELVRIHAIGNSTADDREPVEHERWLRGLLEEQLLQDIEHDGDDNEREEAGEYEDRE